MSKTTRPSFRIPDQENFTVAQFAKLIARKERDLSVKSAKQRIYRMLDLERISFRRYLGVIVFSHEEVSRVLRGEVL